MPIRGVKEVFRIWTERVDRKFFLDSHSQPD